MTGVAGMELTGISSRQLDHWTRRGWLRCEEPRPGGRGYPRAWSPCEREVARYMVQLVAAGVTPEAAHHAARNNGRLPGGRFRVERIDGLSLVAEEAARESA